MYYGEKLWSDEDAREVHENTLNILEKLGIEVQEKQAREDLAKAGCTVDEKTRRVYYPRALVKKTLVDAPAKFDMYDAMANIISLWAEMMLPSEPVVLQRFIWIEKMI